MKGFKGFNKDLTCNGYKYEIGKTHEYDKEPKLCSHGFHFCEHPLDTLGYYAPSESRYAEVEADGVSDEKSVDTKRVCKKLTVKAELSIRGLVEAAVKLVFDKADWSRKENQATGARGAASATGEQGAASATGVRGAASATGVRGAASATGKDSIACGLGWKCKAMGALGNWIVLSERDDDGHILCVKTAKVDGKKIKPEVFYTLNGGKFVEESKS